MQTNLTLRLESELIEEAQKVAEVRETSLSRMVTDYLRALVKQEGSSEVGVLPPVTQSLKGVLSSSTVSEDDHREHLEKNR